MDIDIDFPPSFDPQKLFPTVVRASMMKQGLLTKHPCGHYFQGMGRDEVTGLAAIPYDKATDLGFFKIDFLHLNFLSAFEHKDEVRTLLKVEPNWELLKERSVVEQLFQLSKHYDLVNAVAPTSIPALADCVAMIRPGKRTLLSSYLSDPTAVRSQLYRNKEDDKSAFKRCHAIAYASTIVLQLHLIEAGL